MGFLENKRKQRRLESMSSAEKDAVIRRLERERQKINSEIESILRNYSKESGNRALLRKKRGSSAANSWDYSDN